jgi:hypothetical protein
VPGFFVLFAVPLHPFVLIQERLTLCNSLIFSAFFAKPSRPLRSNAFHLPSRTQRDFSFHAFL